MTSRSTISRRPFALRACAAAVVVALGLAGAAPAHAENLMDVYRQALQSDPVLKQAEAQKRIGQAGEAQSRSLLLPQINGQVSFNDSHGIQSGAQTVLDTNTGNYTIVDTTNHTGGRSRTDSIGLQQVLFDLGKFSQLRASKASAAASAAQLVAARQNLILRVAQAYFTVLTDEDQLKFAKSNAASLKKQLDQAQAKYDVGFAPITDVADAKAQYDSAVAEVISAENTVFNDRQALEEITGQKPGTLDSLADEVPLSPPQPNDINDWVTTALASNPSLQAQRDNVEAARHNVTTARAARLPTLDASVNYSRKPSWGSVGFGPAADSRSSDTSVGLVLSVPLFAGGGTAAQISQSIAQRDQARDVLEQDRRTTVSNTRNAFNAIASGISSVEAEKAAVDSAQEALKAAQAGYDIGTQTITQVLIAQSTYFQALSAYSQARHALVINRLNLKFAAGTLSVKDLQTVNALLQ